LPLFHGQEQHVGLLKDLHSVEEKKRVGEPEGVSDPIEASGASSGPILRPRTSRGYMERANNAIFRDIIDVCTS
jgi:hypothetical protein